MPEKDMSLSCTGSSFPTHTHLPSCGLLHLDAHLPTQLSHAPALRASATYHRAHAHCTARTHRTIPRRAPASPAAFFRLPRCTYCTLPHHTCCLPPHLPPHCLPACRVLPATCLHTSATRTAPHLPACHAHCTCLPATCHRCRPPCLTTPAAHRCPGRHGGGGLPACLPRANVPGSGLGQWAAGLVLTRRMWEALPSRCWIGALHNLLAWLNQLLRRCWPGLCMPPSASHSCTHPTSV